MSEPRRVVVTGGAGALGRAVVSAFLAGGDRVAVPWIVARERDALRAGCEAPDRLDLVEADLGTDDGVTRLGAASDGTEVLVNVAGGFEGGAPFLDTPLEAWDRMYRINLRTAVATTHRLLPGMLDRSRGAVINVGAQAALDPPATLGAYTASKAGVAAFTRSLQQELTGHGVRVNAVMPGTIDTPANRAAMPDADFSSWTPPARIAAVVHWLASDDAAAVRGALIPV